MVRSCDRVFIPLCVLVLASVAQQSRASIVVSDETFADNDWSHQIFLSPGRSGTTSVFQRTTGGNPGAYQRGENDFRNNTRNFVVASFHVFTGFSYDPSASGAIESIDFAYDFNNFNPIHPSNSLIATGLALEQDGKLYATNFIQVRKSAGWVTNSNTGKLATNFSLHDGNAGFLAQNPDFSESGSSIRFGYIARNSTGGSGTIVTWGTDNFSATIHNAPIPEPSTFVILSALGGIGLMCRWRQRLRAG